MVGLDVVTADVGVMIGGLVEGGITGWAAVVGVGLEATGLVEGRGAAGGT